MSDIDAGVVDSLKVLDPKRPIREAVIVLGVAEMLPSLPRLTAIERLAKTIGDIIHCIDPGHSLLMQDTNSMALNLGE